MTVNQKAVEAALAGVEPLLIGCIPGRSRVLVQQIEAALEAAEPYIREEAAQQERERIRERLEEQAAEYRREADEQSGEAKVKLRTAASVVECVTRIVFDDTTYPQQEECPNCGGYGRPGENCPVCAKKPPQQSTKEER